MNKLVKHVALTSMSCLVLGTGMLTIKPTVSYAATITTAIRGNWYFYGAKYSDHSTMMQVKKTTVKEYGVKYSGHQVTSHSNKIKIKVRGHKKQSVRMYRLINLTGDHPSFVPYKLKINGKYHRVLLSPQQGTLQWGIYTHFKQKKALLY
ncbi:hypothetical protein [Secundilactobacillus odoratitofui]|uniref:hypothetical protein n=1 Tax=Secundilactobacillus odoratitofui TaxID=480930 RepID=UPI000A863395|nr:hypothetical protein [Secundilactobacillus odoratitofui]